MTAHTMAPPHPTAKLELEIPLLDPDGIPLLDPDGIHLLVPASAADPTYRTRTQ
jgi:hypothetical protein